MAPAHAAVLHDQFNGASSVLTYSEDGATPNDGQAADDFEVPAGRRWSVDRVDVDGTSHFLASPVSYSVFFFRNAGTLPEAAAFQTTTGLQPAMGTSFDDPGLLLNPPVSLDAGRYWVSVQSIEGNFAGFFFSEWKWANRMTQAGNPAAFRRHPTGTACQAWVVRAGSCMNPAGNPDQVFKLSGTETTLATGGVQGGTLGGSESAPKDRRKPSITIARTGAQDVDRVIVIARSDEASVITARGSIAGVAAHQAARVSFRRARKRVAANARVRLRLRLSRRSLRRAKRTLRALKRRGRRARLTARIRVTATDAAGNSRTVRRRIRLKD